MTRTVKIGKLSISVATDGDSLPNKPYDPKAKEYGFYIPMEHLFIAAMGILLALSFLAR